MGDGGDYEFSTSNGNMGDETDSSSSDGEEYDITETVPDLSRTVARLQPEKSDSGAMPSTKLSRSKRHWLHSSLPKMRKLYTKTEEIERNVYEIQVDRVQGNLTGYVCDNVNICVENL